MIKYNACHQRDQDKITPDTQDKHPVSQILHNEINIQLYYFC